MRLNWHVTVLEVQAFDHLRKQTFHCKLSLPDHIEEVFIVAQHLLPVSLLVLELHKVKVEQLLRVDEHGCCGYKRDLALATISGCNDVVDDLGLFIVLDDCGVGRFELLQSLLFFFLLLGNAFRFPGLLLETLFLLLFFGICFIFLSLFGFLGLLFSCSVNKRVFWSG